MSGENAQNQMVKAPLRGGGGVMAIIPQDIDQVWRLAQMAVVGKMAPKSLIEGKDHNEATAACAIAILAGAELGLTPLMSLRSYAVVNGRPALWGDGLKAVVRQSGRCAYIKTGSDEAQGWCEAKRSDTEEVKRVVFTLKQATAAGLTKKTGPWTAGYADVMMERRATNRCLNDLFADILGGVVSADEAFEDGPMDITPAAQLTRSSPPPVPDAPKPITIEELDAALALANDDDQLIAAWNEALPNISDEDRAEADEVYERHDARLNGEVEGEAHEYVPPSFPGDEP